MTDEAKRNIHQRLAAVAALVPYVKKTVGSGTGNAKGVARDEVVAKLRAHMLAEGILASTSQVGPGTTEKLEKGLLFTAMYATSFINIDDPADRHVVQHEAHGKDFGDKGPGKASTYAEKLNFIKALALETGIQDEARYAEDVKSESEAEPTVGEEKLANFCKSIEASTTVKQVNESWRMARDYINENGGGAKDIERITEAGSKRKGVLATKGAVPAEKE